MANVKKKISELTALTSASLNTVVVGVDNGTTYKIELDVLADGVKDRINTLDTIRLNNLQNFTSSANVSINNLNNTTSSYETKGRGILSGSISYTALTNIPLNIISGSSQLPNGLISGSSQLPNGLVSSSTQISNLGFVSTSVDISSLNSFTSSQSILNIAYTNGINARLQTSSFNDFSASVHTQILAATNEQSLAGFAITGSNVFVGQQTIYGHSSIDFGTRNGIYLKNSATSGNQSNVMGFGSNNRVEWLFMNDINADGTSVDHFDLYHVPTDNSVLSGRPTGVIINGYINATNGITGAIAATNGVISGSTQITNLGFITGSYPTITQYNSLTQSINVISGSVVNLSNNINTGSYVLTSSFNSYTASISTASLVTSITNLNSATSSYEIKGSGILSGSVSYISLTNIPSNIISGSSQLTSSYDSRYVMSGSISVVPIGTISGSAQITSLGFVSGSYLTSLSGAISSSSQLTSSFDTRYTLSGSVSAVPAGIISGSSQLTSSYDLRYTLSGSSVNVNTSSLVTTSSFNLYTASISTASLVTSITNLNTFTSSVATTGSNSFNGSQTITGSFTQSGSLLSYGSSSFSGAVSISGSLIYNGISLQNGFGFAQPLNTKILNNSSYTGAASWRASYTGSGGSVIVRADVTGYKPTTGLGSLSLYRDSVAVATQTYYFNIANTHMALPPLTYVNNNEVGGHTYEVIFSNISADANDFLTIVVSEVTASAIVAPNLISGSSQLTASFDTRYTLSGNVSAVPAGTISGSAQITTFGFVSGSYETIGRSIISSSTQITPLLPSGVISSSAQLTQLNSFTASVTTASLVTSITNLNTFTASAQSVTTGSNSFNGTQIITGSLIVTSGSFIGSQLTANTSSLYLTSGSNLYVQNNGLVEITGSVRISGSNLTYDGTTLKAPYIESTNSIGDEGGEFHLAVAQTNNTLTGSYVVTDIYQSKLRIFEGGGNSRGVSLDLSKTSNGVGGELFWKSSAYVNAGSYVSLDNIKATLTSTGNRGLSLAAVSTPFSASYAGTYGNSGGSSGNSSNGQVLMTTTPTTSLFNWAFSGQGDLSTIVLTDTTNSRTYRITLQVGGGYVNNFIMIERLH